MAFYRSSRLERPCQSGGGAMSSLSAEELRGFPLKDLWTTEETLALIENLDGTYCIHGVPLPFYVQTEGNRVRWASCVRVASQSSGESVGSHLVQQMARVMYADRDRYTD